ncbi:Hypothetical protein SRAE_1000143400 [Strongyloides ratti]|uniref:Uncharacterized protein n=1 Tax=Strongyloides ratti TaxID=34506 RepID=A0A090L078_STRRB|nr:Hypothetical protein SRAE_1000143400 [Strongyloides ratti]CEF63170.1 Hypothetical protein SRAE_1000143400 [Strongyloides ratti]
MYFVIWCIFSFIFIRISNCCFYQGLGTSCECSPSCLESCQQYSEQTFYYAPQAQDHKCNPTPMTPLPRPIPTKYYKKEPLYPSPPKLDNNQYPQLIPPSYKIYPAPPQARIY